MGIVVGREFETIQGVSFDESGASFYYEFGSPVGVYNAVEGSLYWDLTAKVLYFKSGGTSVDWEEVQLNIEALTEFESFSSPGTESTTSNSWVTKSGYPYTSSPKTAGTYVVDFTAQVGQSNKDREVGSRIQWRLGTTGTWNTEAEIRDGVSANGQFQLRTGFFEIVLPADGVFQLRWQYGQTDEGGTGSIKQANIKLGKSAE